MSSGPGERPWPSRAAGGWDDDDVDDVDGDVEGFDDLPETHLEDEDYDEFLAREFDSEGRLAGEPRVAWVIGLAIVLILALALFLSL